MIKIKKSEEVPTSLAVEKEKANGTYNTPEVLKQLASSSAKPPH